jgi:hypothetical protein
MYGTGRDGRVIDACVLVTPLLTLTTHTHYSLGRAIRNSDIVAYLLRRLIVALLRVRGSNVLAYASKSCTAKDKLITPAEGSTRILAATSDIHD